MTFPVPISSEDLLLTATRESLYPKLLEQINKDFTLANEAVDFPKSTTPEELTIQLHEKLYRLISFRFAEYLNLLYIIDVPESEVKKLDGSNLAELSGQVAFLVLKREWQKVWFRNRL